MEDKKHKFKTTVYGVVAFTNKKSIYIYIVFLLVNASTPYTVVQKR